MRVSPLFSQVVGLSLLGVAACSSSSGSPATEKGDSGGGLNLPDSGGLQLPDTGLQLPDAGSKDTGTPDTSTTTHDAGKDGSTITPPTDADLNTYPAFDPIVPQVQNLGGHVLANPIFVPVFFAGDEYQAQLETYVAAIGQSQYWTATTSEYGVGAGISGTPIIMQETMPSSIDDGTMQTWLANRIGTDPRFGALPGTSVVDAGSESDFDAGPIDASAPLHSSTEATAPDGVVYVLFMPSGTTVTEGGGASCTDFGGYHNSFYAPNGSNVVYAMIPRCASFGEGLNGIDAVTGAASHELIEASTDPFVGGNGNQVAYGQVDINHFIWEEVLGGGEVGDMCAQFPGVFYHPSEASMSAFTVQRSWSNAAAAAGGDPCVPALPAAEEPYYFNAVPNFGEITAQVEGQNFSTIGGTVPVNTPTTIELDLFSSASTNGEKFQVQAFDANELTGSGSSALVFSPAQVTGVNGDKLTMTVTNTGAGGATHPFILISQLGASQFWWVGVIAN